MRDSLGAVQRILVLGGGSDIGVAIAARLAAPRRASVVLAGRSVDAMGEAARHLESSVGSTVALAHFDALDTASHARVLSDLWDDHGGFDVVVLAFGVQGSQEKAEDDPLHGVDVVATNGVGVVSAGLALAPLLRAQGHGSMVVVSSVAAERTRRSLFVYAASKAAADSFALGLHDALAPSGVHVLVVRPGFVRTKLTAHLKPPPGPLATTPAAVADVVERALLRRARITWAPPAMRWVMVVLRHLPHAVFRRLPI